jgi:hypothetical protein
VRGVRQRRPSGKANEHKDTRSFLCAAAERPTGLREDINVSLELSFGIAEEKRAQAEACATKNRNAPAEPGRSLQHGYCTTTVTRVKLEIKSKRKVKTRTLKPEGCGTPRASAPPAQTSLVKRHQKTSRLSPSSHCKSTEYRMRHDLVFPVYFSVGFWVVRRRICIHSLPLV